MAEHILSNPPSKLNLSHRQIALFQKILLEGNKMARELKTLDKELALPNRKKKPYLRWGQLMVELVEMLC